MDMIEYTKRLRRMNYAELLKEKKNLDEFIREYDEGISPEDPRWQKDEDPDVQYYHSLLALEQLYGFLSEAYLKDLEKKVLAKSREFNAHAVLFTDPVEESIEIPLTEMKLDSLITK